MSGGLLLLSGGLAVRLLGSALRVGNPGLPARSAGWLLCMTAAWVVAGAVGAWSPVWPVVVLALIGAFAAFRLQHAAVWVVADLVGVMVFGRLSIPAVGFTPLLGAAAALAGAGWAIDWLLARVPRRVRLGMVALPCAACIALGVARYDDLVSAMQYLRQTQLYRIVPHLGVMAERQGERLVLETGAIAWLARPPGDGPFPGALLFHGAHRDGSHQSAALILRRALLHAGFSVLAVDHPGFGESPAPRIDGGIEQWDPLPGNLAALRVLRSMSAVDGIFAVGHSMGTLDVFRLCQAGVDLRGAIVFGASLGDSSERDDYWYRRFHSDRRLRDHLPPDAFVEIRKRFYDREVVRALPPDHAPILFVRFEIEHANIVETRDALYAMIPGRKTAWNLAPSNHYFSSQKAAGIVIGDTRVIPQLASKLRLLRDEPPDPMSGKRSEDRSSR